MSNKDGRLAGKVAFITGAGSGIARAAAGIFAREGASVVIAELKTDLGRASEEVVKAAGGEATFIQTDVTKEDSVRQSIAAAVQRYGGLHVLYNCAGGSIPQDTLVTEVDMNVWNHTISFDLLGAFLCSRHGIPEIIKSGGGAVVNMSSVAALMGFTPAHVYVAAKGGIISLTKAMACDYAEHRIRVNAICPGAVMTERVKSRTGPAASRVSSKFNERMKGHPFAVGEPEDIANIALFLASDESRMISGAIIAADGGLSSY
ncbi:MAG TPA: SDR family oxidoreductase [Candidatus Binataceae bacterium]|jgi:NAD(P)-dependent dehydrogenase (short-subunit alcohol dehydrogenase family)|nr:SDR family oxidoreductase [Candidatus Binataceae bacterium]